MSATVQIAGTAELSQDLSRMPVLDVVMEVLLPVDVIHVGVVPQARGVLPEYAVKDLLGVVGADDAASPVPEPVLELNHMEDISNVV